MSPGQNSKDPSVFERHPWRTILTLVFVAIVVIDVAVKQLIGTDGYSDFRCADSRYHHGLIPNKKRVSKWGDGPEYPVFTNSLGFLDKVVREVPLTTSKRRVICIGDSYTEGIGLPYEKTFVGILDELLDGDGTEILNAAAISYCPKLYFFKIEHLLEEVGLRFDGLVVFIDISDIQDEILYRKFESKPPGVVDRMCCGIKRFLAENSYTYSACCALLRKHVFTRESKKYQAESYPPWLNYFWLDDTDEEPKEDPQFVRVRDSWTSPDFYKSRWTQEGIRSAVLYMGHLVKLCKAHGIDVTIVVYPWLTQIFQGDLDSQQVKLWRRFAEENGVSFINLFPVFVKEGVRPSTIRKRYFLPGDWHWNEEGHRLVAECVLPSLRR